MDWRSLIPGMRKVRQDFAAELAQKKAQLELLEREKARLTYAPSSREDLKRFVAAHVTSAAAVGRVRLQANLQPFARQPAEIAKLTSKEGLSLLLAGALQRGTDEETARAVESVLAFALGEQLISAMSAAIDSMELTEGPTLAERRLAIEKVDGQINGLAVEIDEMTQAAQASGLFIE